MADPTTRRHPSQEATDRIPEGWTARVLEPSPPAVVDGDFFADDPASLGTADRSTTVLPISNGSPTQPTWESQAAGDDDLAAFAREHWLGPWPQLGIVPSDYVESREDFHRLAYGVVAAARYGENGKFGLRFTAGGFGTPFFGDDRQVRVVGNVLVDQTADEVRTLAPSTIAQAAAFLNVEPSTVAAEGDSPELGDPERPLLLSSEVGDFLGRWFGFATSVLEELRALSPADADADRVQLWPGHFDPAVEIGNQEAGHRATFGASPGDGGSDHPYLYVGPWAGTSDDPFWNATSFPGAVLSYDELRAADDQRGAALAFYTKGIEILTA